VSPLGIVEALDVVEHVGHGLIPRALHLRGVRSVFNDEKKLSIAALSHTLPERLIEQTTPFSAISRWNCSLVYCAHSIGRRRTGLFSVSAREQYDRWRLKEAKKRSGRAWC
jgi:hypothetical protein